MLKYFRDVIAAKRSEDRGASAVEYALLIAAIAALIVIVVFAFGGLVKDIFSDTCESIAGGGTSTSTANAEGNCDE